MNRSPPGNIPVNHHPLQVNESLTYTNETWDAARFSEMPRHASTYSHASKLIDRMSVPFPFGSVLNLCSVRSTCLFPLSRPNSELRFFYSLTFRSAFYLIKNDYPNQMIFYDSRSIQIVSDFLIPDYHINSYLFSYALSSLLIPLVRFSEILWAFRSLILSSA